VFISPPVVGRDGGGAGIGALMRALERTCSGMRSAGFGGTMLLYGANVRGPLLLIAFGQTLSKVPKIYTFIKGQGIEDAAAGRGLGVS
jgi:hypothetical protein